MKTSNRKLRHSLGALFLGAMTLMPLAACDHDDGPFEEIGEEVDDAVDDVKDKVDDVKDEVQDAKDEVQDEVQDAADQHG